jgi:hypothetical protein
MAKITVISPVSRLSDKPSRLTSTRKTQAELPGHVEQLSALLQTLKLALRSCSRGLLIAAFANGAVEK